MKKIFAIFPMLFCIILVSCRHQDNYSFLNNRNEISSISIVMVSFDDAGQIVETELQQIENVDSFLEDFQKINCYTYYGDPLGLTEEGVEASVIKIVYKNNEYELINWNGQATYTNETGFRYYAGYNVFDESQFNSLIQSYILD